MWVVFELLHWRFGREAFSTASDESVSDHVILVPADQRAELMALVELRFFVIDEQIVTLADA